MRIYKAEHKLWLHKVYYTSSVMDETCCSYISSSGLKSCFECCQRKAHTKININDKKASSSQGKNIRLEWQMKVNSLEIWLNLQHCLRVSSISITFVTLIQFWNTSRTMHFWMTLYIKSSSNKETKIQQNSNSNF